MGVCSRRDSLIFRGALNLLFQGPSKSEKKPRATDGDKFGAANKMGAGR
jgi:hypothetical protein